MKSTISIMIPLNVSTQYIFQHTPLIHQTNEIFSMYKYVLIFRYVTGYLLPISESSRRGFLLIWLTLGKML